MYLALRSKYCSRLGVQSFKSKTGNNRLAEFYCQDPWLSRRPPWPCQWDGYLANLPSSALTRSWGGESFVAASDEGWIAKADTFEKPEAGSVRHGVIGMEERNLGQSVDLSVLCLVASTKEPHSIHY